MRTVKERFKSECNIRLDVEEGEFDFNAINGFEIHPWRVTNPGEIVEDVEQCEPEEAHFFSVYAHLKEGGLYCLVDCDTEAAATIFLQMIEQVVKSFAL